MTAFAQQIDVAVKNSLAATQRAIVAIAKGEYAEIMGRDPRPINFVRHVDGREAPEEAVRPDGVIVYDYNRLDLVAKDALRLLRENSPVGKAGDPHPGLYRDSHRLFLNQRPVDSLKGWKPGDEISISNTVEYSRVIELNARGGSKFQVAGGGHVYEKTAQALRRTYRNTADIEFTFRAVLEGSQINQLTQSAAPLSRNKASGRFAARGGVGAHNKADARWPTIVINPAGSFTIRAGLR